MDDVIFLIGVIGIVAAVVATIVGPSYVVISALIERRNRRNG